MKWFRWILVLLILVALPLGGLQWYLDQKISEQHAVLEESLQRYGFGLTQTQKRFGLLKIDTSLNVRDPSGHITSLQAQHFLLPSLAWRTKFPAASLDTLFISHIANFDKTPINFETSVSLQGVIQSRAAGLVHYKNIAYQLEMNFHKDNTNLPAHLSLSARAGGVMDPHLKPVLLQLDYQFPVDVTSNTNYVLKLRLPELNYERHDQKISLKDLNFLASFKRGFPGHLFDSDLQLNLAELSLNDFAMGPLVQNLEIKNTNLAAVTQLYKQMWLDSTELELSASRWRVLEEGLKLHLTSRLSLKEQVLSSEFDTSVTSYEHTLASDPFKEFIQHSSGHIEMHWPKAYVLVLLNNPYLSALLDTHASQLMLDVPVIQAQTSSPLAAPSTPQSPTSANTSLATASGLPAAVSLQELNVALPSAPPQGSPNVAPSPISPIAVAPVVLDKPVAPLDASLASPAAVLVAPGITDPKSEQLDMGSIQMARGLKWVSLLLQGAYLKEENGLFSFDCHWQAGELKINDHLIILKPEPENKPS